MPSEITNIQTTALLGADLYSCLFSVFFDFSLNDISEVGETKVGGFKTLVVFCSDRKKNGQTEKKKIDVQ